MKNILFITLSLLFASSAFAYSTVLTMNISSTSNRSCKDANSKLVKKVDDYIFTSIKEVIKVKLSPCKSKSVVRDVIRYTQTAEIQFEVNQIQDNY